MTSSVGPPSPPPPASPPPAPPVVTVPQAPAAVLALPPGTAVEVRILTAATQGLVEVDGGDLGRFPLRTPLALPAGATLTLQMATGRGETAQMRLTAVDGKPIAQALQGRLAPRPAGVPPAAAGIAGGSGGSAAPQIVTWSLGSGPTLDGVVLRTPPGGLPLGAGHAPLTAGTPLSLRLAPLPGAGPAPGWPAGHGGTVPGAAPSPSAPQAGAPPPGTPGAASPAGGRSAGPSLPPAAAPGAAAPTAAAGATGSAAPATVPPSGQATTASATGPGISGGGAPGQGPHRSDQGAAASGPTPPSPASAGASRGTPPLALLAATVSPNSAGGHAMVRVGDSLIAVGGRNDLPAGAEVTLEIVTRGAPPPPPPLPPPLTQPLAALPGGGAGAASAWPSLSEALDILARSDPQAARQMAASLPGADQRLVVNTLAFAAAARAGDPRPWLGDGPLKALERSGERGRQLARQLGEETREIGSRGREPRGDWRLLQMPFAGGGAIDRVEIVTRRLWGRDDTEEEEEKRKRSGDQDGGKRFLVNITFSHLGPFQIDGLFTAGRRTLDVVIRTAAPLPADVRRAITAIHARSARALDLSGSVAFHVSDRFPGPDDDGGIEGGGLGDGHGVTA